MAKRVFDLSLVLLGAPLWLPVLAIVALCVRLKLGSPVFFRQRRTGLKGEIFELVKFRTMTEGIDPSGRRLPDADRLTPFGQKLRSTSLDELPELLNVLRGQMSLVGPRPLLPEYLGRYNARQAMRHRLKPGLTGLAQVKGRNALNWSEKLELDVVYVENRSLWQDLSIIVETLRIVLTRRGIATPGHATAPEFNPQAEE